MILGMFLLAYIFMSCMLLAILMNVPEGDMKTITAFGRIVWFILALPVGLIVLVAEILVLKKEHREYVLLKLLKKY